MQSSHFPLIVVSDMIRPSTRLFLAISWIVNGLQCVSRRCHCPREVGLDRDVIVMGFSGGLLILSDKYMPLTFRPDNTTVPSALQVIPFPLPKVVISPALSNAPTETKLAFKVSVWRARV